MVPYYGNLSYSLNKNPVDTELQNHTKSNPSGTPPKQRQCWDGTWYNSFQTNKCLAFWDSVYVHEH